MRKALVYFNYKLAGELIEHKKGSEYSFSYLEKYDGHPISLTMPTNKRTYSFDSFPPFFDGLLPEGIQLEGLLRAKKIDKTDYFSQLLAVGNDLVGAVTIKENM